jgi:drug/metabolite transporter (DMT)-like permease
MDSSKRSILGSAGFYFALLIIGCACTGSVPLWVRLADVGSATAGVWRMVFALPFLLLWMYFEPNKGTEENPITEVTRPVYGLLAFAGGIFALDILLFNSALSYVPVTNVAILAGLSPFVILGKAVIFEKLRLTPSMIAALIVAFMGVVLLTLAPSSVEAPLSNALSQGSFWYELLGSILALGSSISFGLYLLCLRQVRHYHVPPGRIVGISVIFAAIGCLILALLFGENLWPKSLKSWLSLVGLGAVGHFLGHGLMTIAFRHVPAVVASSSIFLLPGFSALLAWIFLNESVSVIQILGGALVLSALLYLSPRKETSSSVE